MLIVSICGGAQEWKQLRMTSLPNRGYEIRTAKGELLGYSERGSLAQDTVQPQMREWLNYVNAAATRGIQMAPARKTGKAVKPLLTTQWSQDAPYNNQCPYLDGSSRCATGCVATAMAQIMNYWEWPVSGKGSPYNVQYDWANMRDQYTSGYSTAEATAVATLMYRCGLSCDMDYGESSGADDKDATKALREIFYYSDDIDYLSRNDYNYQQWDSIVRAELDAGRPVMHSGYTTSFEGHEFVCDGYDQNGYFHFNWGWGGQSDGYYLLTALTPLSQGTGGSSNGEGFNYRENIAIRIYPNQGTDYQPVGGLLQCSSLAVWSQRGRSLNIGVQTIKNASLKDMKVVYGFALYDTLGNKLQQLDSTTVNLSTGDDAYYNPSTFSFPNEIPNGSYYVRLDYRHKNKAGDTGWHSGTGNGGCIQQLKIELSDNSISYETPTDVDTARLSLISLSPVSRVVKGYKTQIRCTVVNQSDVEFNDVVQVFMINKGTDAITTFGKSVAIFHARDTTTLDFVETVPSIATGAYCLGIYIPHQSGNAEEDYTTELYDQRGWEERTYYTWWGDDFTLGTASGFNTYPQSLQVTFDHAKIDKDSTTTVHAVVTYRGAYFADYITPYLIQGSTKKQAIGIQQFVTLEKGDTVTLDIPIEDVRNLECGTYGLGLYIADSRLIGGQQGSLEVSSAECEESVLEEVEAQEASVRKIWRDGEMLIVRDGKAYDVLGRTR